MTVSHKMLILGDMRELGTESLNEHQKIVDYMVSEFKKMEGVDLGSNLAQQ